MLGDSPAFRQMMLLLHRFKKTDLTMLLEGPSGGGKDKAARFLHDNGPRRAGPFIEVSCGNVEPHLAVSDLFGHVRGAYTGATSDRKGAFELAHGGTLFLNEIGDMPLEVQVKILRVIQFGIIQRLGETRDIHVDVRVIAATWLDLPAMVANGEFRSDLYHRLAVGLVDVPPLTDRDNDVLLIARALLKTAPGEHSLPSRTLSGDAVAVLKAYDWPGNIRELDHVLQRALALGSGRSVTADHLVQAISSSNGKVEIVVEPPDPPTPLRVLAGGESMRAADLRSALGVSKTQLSRLLKPLIEAGHVVREGKGVATRYHLAGLEGAVPKEDPRWDMVVTLARQTGSVTRRQLTSTLQFSDRTSTRILRAMVKAGLLTRSNERGRGVAYRVPTE
jgi:DNA-binding NtrC family response regulator